MKAKYFIHYRPFLRVCQELKQKLNVRNVKGLSRSDSPSFYDLLFSGCTLSLIFIAFDHLSHDGLFRENDVVTV